MQDWAVAIRHVVVDLGFRGVDADNPDQHLIHRGKFKRLSPQHRTWLRRRSAVEPAIGHLKADHRLDRCWLKGALGDALHAISCAAGYNIQWLSGCCAPLSVWGWGRFFCACCGSGAGRCGLPAPHAQIPTGLRRLLKHLISPGHPWRQQALGLDSMPGEAENGF
jgi:hypothetical protein